MKHLAHTSRKFGLLCLPLVAAIALFVSGCQESNSVEALSQTRSAETESPWIDMQVTIRSALDEREYMAVVENGVASFSLDGRTVDKVPADVAARAGQRYYAVVNPTPTISKLSLDTEKQTLSGSTSFSTTFVDILLLIVSMIFAVAFFITGFFLLRVARQRRILNESRIRQLRAREAERTHLAAELHDGPVQELQHVMRSYFGALAQSASKNAANILDIQSQLENVTASLRNICTELRPPVLAHFGLAYAIRSYADKHEQRLRGTTVHVDVREEDSLESDELSLAFFRIFQESLSNIEKHAHAENVWIDLLIEPKWVEMVIRDDGDGFVLPRKLVEFEEEGHLGLSGLAQRAEAVGGVFEVRSNPGEGTTIRVVARKQPQDDHGLVRANAEPA